jgi:hypothetical protein
MTLRRGMWSVQLTASALLLCNCALSPRDGQVVASRSTAIHYQFVVPWPNPDIYVEAARYDASGNFAYWDLEWGCNLQVGGCGESKLGLTDGQGSDQYWIVNYDLAIPTTVLGGTRHWIPTGLSSPKWKTQVHAFAAPTNTHDYSSVATFANTSAATSCIVDKFSHETGASAAVNCDTGTYVANLYATAN